MLVLHMSLFDGQALIWGESPVAPGRGGRRKPPEGRVPRSPHDVDAATLVKAITDATGMVLHYSEGVPLLAWLPSQGDRPLPSRLIASDTAPEDGGEINLRPWVITTIPLYTDNAADLLAACRGRTILAPGVVVAPDLAFGSLVLELAASMVSQGQILPSLRRSPFTGHYAVWEPLFLGTADQSRHQLAKALPDICRCLNHDPAMIPASPALSVVSDWLTVLVDGLVRMGAQTVAARTQRGVGTAWSRRPATVHDAWLKLLTTPLAFFQMAEDKEPALDALLKDAQEWHRKVARLAAAPFRLCFHLQEPTAANDEPENNEKQDSEDQTDDQTWNVSYLLQAKHDPSLLLPVAEIWQPSTQIKKLFAGFSVSAPELLLSSLGQAASLCPQVEESLKGPTPNGFTMDTEQAFHFLQTTAPLLSQAGFGVMLPNWWSGRSRKRLSARGRVASPPMSAGGMLTLDHLVQIDWQVALGDEVLAMDELKALAELKAPLVNLRGQWVEVNPREIQSMLRQWQKKRPKRLTTRDLVHLSLGSGESPVGLPLAGIEASGWIGDLLDQLDGKVPFAVEPVPSGLHATLRPYQERGFSWLTFLRRWGLGACLADDMGLGKTIQTLTLLQQQRQAGEARPVLLVCPTSLVGNWQRESQRFTPDLVVMIHHGQSRPRGEAFVNAVKPSHLVITSYALLGRDLEQFQEVAWAGVILDEAQNIKNPSTKQAQAARSIQADYRIALTGTPVENNVGDLWSIMEFLNPGLLGSQADFKRDFFIPIQVQRDTEAMAKLQQLTGPFVLRRLKTDKTIIQDLPDKIEGKVFCPLTKEQASLYAAVVKNLEERLHEAEGIERSGLVLATLSKLKQVCNHPAQFLGDHSQVGGRSGKLTRLVEMCEELLSVGDKALIFTQFAEMGEILRQHLIESLGREVLFLHGGTSKKERDAMVESFQSSHGPPLFVLSLKAGGTGLNLTQASHVFHFDRWWNPAVENQATDRAFRIGQQKNVQVHKFVCQGTLEERIDQIIEQKRSIAADIVGTGEGWLTTLSIAELKDIFALSREALEE